jgi:DNA-directed RNA polymerase subunit RPC12/RpoP
MKVMLKGCTRCGGDLVRARIDAETESVTCLQCGYERDVAIGNAWVRQVLQQTSKLEAPSAQKHEVAA